MKDTQTSPESLVFSLPKRLRRAFKNGTWEIELESGDQPEIEVIHDGRWLQSPDAEKSEGDRWIARFEVPVSSLADGVQTFLLCDRRTGTTIDTLTIMAGDAIEDDIRAELDLMRAELVLLKKAFRRHCVDSES